MSGLSKSIAVSILSFAIGCSLASSTAHAQPFGFLNLLNPEGSRLFPGSLVAPRHPGKPDPRWKDFTWKYLDLKEKDVNFRLYYYENEYWSARFAIPELRKEIDYLQGKFNFSPPEKFNYLLFATHRDFQQTNVFNISEGVQGVTATTEPTMAIPYWGEAATFKHISTHEMVHQFQTQKISSISEGHGPMIEALIPLWFIEGMAEQYSLHGVDAESRTYLRDLLVNANEERSYKMPDFFSDEIRDFVNTYKVGQARIDFLENEFGPGTAQVIFESAGRKLGRTSEDTFTGVIAAEVKLDAAQVNDRWKEYVKKRYQTEADKLTQTFDGWESVPGLSDTVDLYDVSPNGELIAVREIDILTGRTYINLIDTKDGFRKIESAADFEPDLLRLYFMQLPTLALSNETIVYIVETTEGPEVELRKIQRKPDGKIRLVGDYRIKIHRQGITEAHSPAISPDQTKLAFVGLDPAGRQNVYMLDISPKAVNSKPEPLTYGAYSWRNLSWSPQGILASSDRTPDEKYGIFLLDPKTRALKLLAKSDANLDTPEGTPDDLLYQSYQSGTPQIHALRATGERRLTDVKTSIMRPKLRGDTLYAIGLKGGRFILYKVPKNKRLDLAVNPSSKPKQEELPPPWEPVLANPPIAEVQKYKAFSSSGIRIDNLGAFFGSGSVFGATVSASDLMRDYGFSAEFLALGSIKNTTANAFLEKQEGRTNWVTGIYYTVLPQADVIYQPNDQVNFYLHREYGGVFAMQYPFGAFFFTDAEVRVGAVKRTDYSDPNYVQAWEAQNPGTEFMIAPVFRLGYDRILYEFFTGPLKGYGILFEADTSFFPARGAITERLRLDLSQYFQISGPTVIALQGILGGAYGGKYRNPFYVSSDDIFRAYPFGDDRLLGTYLVGAKAEFRFPIGTLFGFPPLRGMVGGDIGTIYNQPGQFATGINSSYSFGLNFNIPPISISLIDSIPIRVAPGPKDSSVVHFTLRYLYL